MVCMNIHMSRNCVIRNLTCMNHHAKKSKKAGDGSLELELRRALWPVGLLGFPSSLSGR